MIQALGLVSRVRQSRFALMAQWNIHGSGCFFEGRKLLLNAIPNRFDRLACFEDRLRERRVRTQDTEQQMLGIDVLAAELAGGVPSIENYLAGRFRVSLEHADTAGPYNVSVLPRSAVPTIA